MKNVSKPIEQINSIAALHHFIGLDEPTHPLISVTNCSEMRYPHADSINSFVLHLYSISIVSDYQGKRFKYGQDYYGFNDGTLCFLGPGHVINVPGNASTGGTSVTFHPDLLHNSALAMTIKEYDFFTYAVNEALQLSAAEERDLMAILNNIKKESETRSDSFTEKVIISQLDLFLTYCARFYKRQYLTVNRSSHHLIGKLESYFEGLFNTDILPKVGIPTVQTISEQLFISPTHLSDVVRSVTGQNTQQYIHSKIIERAKILLGNTRMNVNEVAYTLGFDYVQSFNKLFKKKVSMSPMSYRKTFS